MSDLVGNPEDRFSCVAAHMDNGGHLYLSRDARKNLSSGFSTRSDTNRAVQLQKQARSLKSRIWEEEKLYFPCSENKDADQLAVTAKLICAFVFTYADCWFSHGAAHLYFAYSAGEVSTGKYM